jgi:hypothetical protein
MRNKMMKPHQEAKMMGYQDGGTVRRGVVNRRGTEEAMVFADRLAEAMDKPRGDVTGMDGDRMDRMMGINRGRMSSGGRRPAMRKNRLV